MTIIEIWLTALALAMDSFTVAITAGLILKRVRFRHFLTIAFFFGAFQALMPLMGWAGSIYLHRFIEHYDHWIAFAILAFLGVRMIMDSFKEEEEKTFNPRKLGVIFTLAIATSIDALAVGVSFSCMGIVTLNELFYPLVVIGFVSSLMSLIGLFLGIYCGKGFARSLRAELWGGIILLLIGVKVLFEHLLA